jgi:transcriptional regulator with XRE-family HTH domain
MLFPGMRDAMENSAAINGVLAKVGPRLKGLRAERGLTLSALTQATGISTSTLSRLESGRRRPSLELLLPIAQAYRVPLEELVGAPEVGDPRIQLSPRRLNRMTVLPLTRQPGSPQAYKIIIEPDRPRTEPQTHEGYEWLYVLSGRLRLLLAERDLVLRAGEAAEFDTRVPHWFGCADDQPVEILILFGSQGERMHVRARPQA